MKKAKGFTVIELLVVVTIISVLSVIVLTNINRYINRGKDSSIQGNLSSLIVNSSVWFEGIGNGSFTEFCADTTATNPLAAADKAYDGNSIPDEVTVCNASETEWAACGQLKVSDAYFCVDFTGAKKIIDTRSDCNTKWTSTECP